MKQFAAETLQKSIQIQQPGHKFYCKTHDKKKIKYFCHENNEFMCSVCIYEKDASKHSAFSCTESDITEHTDDLITKVKFIKDKAEKSIQELEQIQKKSMT